MSLSFVVPNPNMVQEDAIWTLKHTRNMSSFVQIQTLVFGSNTFLSLSKRATCRDVISDLERLFALLSSGDRQYAFSRDTHF